MSKKDILEIGNAIKKRRLSKGLSYEELAVKSGVHHNTIRAIERGSGCTLGKLDMVCRALRCRIKDVVK